MMDATGDYNAAVAAAWTVYNGAVTTQSNAYNSSVNTIVASTDAAAAPFSADLAADQAAEQQAINNTISSATQTDTTSDAAADQAASSSEQAADNVMNSAVSAAQNNLATTDAADETQSAANIAGMEANLASQEAQHQSDFNTAVSAAQSTRDGNIATDNANVNSANQTLANNFQAAYNNIQANVTAQDNAAQTAEEAQIGSAVSLVSNQQVVNSPSYQAGLGTAENTYENTITGLQNTLDSDYTAAENLDAQQEQTATNGMNNTIAGDAATAASQDQTAQNNYNTAVTPFQTALNSTLAADQTAYNNAETAASTQFASDTAANLATEQSAQASADATYNTNAQPVINAYNQFVTNREATESTTEANRQTQYNNEVNQHAATYNSTVAADAATDQSQDNGVVAAYNSGVQGLAATLASNNQSALSTFQSTVSGADATLESAINTYNQTVMQIYQQAEQSGQPPSQAAITAAYNTLLSADHAHANAVAGAQVTLTSASGTNSINYWTQEEGLFVTEQNGLATNDGNYLTQVAAAFKLQQDSDSDSLASCNSDIATDQSNEDNDILTQYGSEQTTLRGFEDTRDKAYITAETAAEQANTTAYQTEWKSDIAAEQQQAQSDTAAYALYGSQILGPWQLLQNALMAVTAQQMTGDQAAIALADGQIATAKAQAVNTEEGDSVSMDSQFYGAAQAFANQAGAAYVSAVSTLTENDPGSMTVAQAQVAFVQACLANDAAAQAQIDPIERSALSQQVANWVNFIGQCDSEQTAFIAKVIAAQTTQVSKDAASVVSTGNQEITEGSNLANEEILAAAGEVWQQALAYVADSLAWATAEGARYAAYVSDATTWLNTVIPAAVSDQQTLNSDAAALMGQAQTVIDAGAHLIHTAQQNLTDNLIAPGQALINSLSLAKKAFVIAMVTQQSADANTASQNNANNIQNQPDANFSGETSGAAGMLFMGQPPVGEVPTMRNIQQSVQPTKAEQILLDNCTTLQNLVTEAQGILNDKSPELTAILAAAYNSANNLSITTKWDTYPRWSGRPHCADFATAIKSAAVGVQQSKYTFQNLAFSYTGNHGTMVTNEATGKSIFIYVSPVMLNFWTYNYTLDGKVFGPTMHVVDGDLERAEDQQIKEKLQFEYDNEPFWFGG